MSDHHDGEDEEPKDALDLIPVPDRIGPLRAR
jgi:hypothetical protein